MKISKHFMTERAGRYAYIASTVGVGEVVHTIDRTHISGRQATVSITSTGVILVRDLEGGIITMYLARLTEIAKYFDEGIVPMVLAAVVHMNMKRGRIEEQNNYD